MQEEHNVALGKFRQIYTCGQCVYGKTQRMPYNSFWGERGGAAGACMMQRVKIRKKSNIKEAVK